ncbi:MAG: hypothetical protein Q8K60_01545 [Parachlamydiaceae bacterium]|nr:hypothetical protein [Parachlamydiaceae bacterium]
MNSLLSIGIGFSAIAGTITDKDPFIESIHKKVTDVIDHSQNYPGLNSAEFDILKPGLKNYWNTLVENGVVIETNAADRDVRPYFVTLQGIIEQVLANELGQEISSLTGVIHTAEPATPLCLEGSPSKKDESFSETMHPSVENDPLRSFTVHARKIIVRDFLFKGGTLYIAYPQNGINKRNETQQSIYNQELINYPKNLFNRPLNCEAIENDLTGAFYLFKSPEGKTYGFALKITQANNPLDSANVGFWFAELTKESPLNERISNIIMEVLTYSSNEISLPIEY